MSPKSVHKGCFYMSRWSKQKCSTRPPSDIDFGKRRDFWVVENPKFILWNARKSRRKAFIRVVGAFNTTDPTTSDGITVFSEPVQNMVNSRMSSINACNSHFTICLGILLRGITDTKEFLVRIHALDSINHGNFVFKHIPIRDEIDHFRNVYKGEILEEDRTFRRRICRVDETAQEGIELKWRARNIDELWLNGTSERSITSGKSDFSDQDWLESFRSQSGWVRVIYGIRSNNVLDEADIFYVNPFTDRFTYSTIY